MEFVALGIEEIEYLDKSFGKTTDQIPEMLWNEITLHHLNLATVGDWEYNSWWYHCAFGTYVVAIPKAPYCPLSINQ